MWCPCTVCVGSAHLKKSHPTLHSYMAHNLPVRLLFEWLCPSVMWKGQTDVSCSRLSCKVITHSEASLLPGCWQLTWWDQGQKLSQLHWLSALSWERLVDSRCADLHELVLQLGWNFKRDLVCKVLRRLYSTLSCTMMQQKKKSVLWLNRLKSRVFSLMTLHYRGTGWYEAGKWRNNFCDSNGKRI